MFYHMIRTYCPGPQFRSGRLTRAAIVRICKRLSEQWGTRVSPEAISDGFIEVEVPVGYKACRMHSWPHRYPRIKGDEMTRWMDDETVVFPDLKRSGLYLKAFDGPVWLVYEVVDICRALEQEGCVLKVSTIPRKFLPYYESGHRLQALWEEKTKGLAVGDIIHDDAALGLLYLGGVDVTKEVRFGPDLSIADCIRAYFNAPVIRDPVTVVVGDESFEVRRKVLTENSDVFKAMLSTPMVEGLTNTVDLTGAGIPARVLQKILQELDQYKPRILPSMREHAVEFGQVYLIPRLL